MEAHDESAGNAFLRRTAQIAAVGAAVGAAIGAARAGRSGRGDADGDGREERGETAPTPDAGDAEPTSAGAPPNGEEDGSAAERAEAAEPEAEGDESDVPSAEGARDEGEPEAAAAPRETGGPEEEGEEDDADRHRAGPDDAGPEEPTGSAGDDGDREEAAGRSSAGRLVRDAMRQLADVTGREPEAVLGLERRDGGWVATVEIVELSRVPSTTDVLATYEVVLDDDGDLREYRRTGRYVRGRANAEGGDAS